MPADDGLFRLSAAVVAVALTLSACTADDADSTPESAGSNAGGDPAPVNAVALAADPAGGFFWASLEGTVHTEDGSLVATVDVTTEGQRGLVGLAVGDAGQIYGSWVRPDGRLVVGELATSSFGEHRLLWIGPETVRGGNGGRILVDADGSLLLGVGLLNDRPGQANPEELAGKLIRLDPAGEADQVPEILSGPWNNPFALAVAADGTVWVADNEPRDGDERIARGDQGFNPPVIAVLPKDTAPTGLAIVDDELWICSYNTRELLRYRMDGSPVRPAIAEDCLLDVTTLADGSVIYSTGESIESISK